MNEMLPIIDPPSPVAAHIQTKSSTRAPARRIAPTDCPGIVRHDFIDDCHLHALLQSCPDRTQARDVIAKSLAKQPLALAETAALLNATEPELDRGDLRGRAAAEARRLRQPHRALRAALHRQLLRQRLHLLRLSPLQPRRRSPHARRRRGAPGRWRRWSDHGHKRLILVFGEHPRYDAPVHRRHRASGSTRRRAGKGEIRRVNINAAPLDVAGYRVVKDAGIGTYQVFQETYHHATYARVHPAGHAQGRLPLAARGRSAGRWRRGCDDVGIGALFGLYDWRFEVLGLVRHALALQERYNCGPHTISFPRLRPASGVDHGRPLARQRPRLQAAGGDPAPERALHRHDPHRPGARRPCATRSWASASPRSTPAAASNWAATPRPATHSSRSPSASSSNWATSARSTRLSGSS